MTIIEIRTKWTCSQASMLDTREALKSYFSEKSGGDAFITQGIVSAPCDGEGDHFCNKKDDDHRQYQGRITVPFPFRHE